MRLTSFTDYSLRVLIYLGLKPDEVSTITEIAERYMISRNHLMKVVHELGRMGYVETIRGNSGGIRLRCDPSVVSLGELVRRTEADLTLVECFGADNRCRLTSACVLRGVISEALQAFLDVLDRHTLEDLLTPRQELAGLLTIAASD